MSNPKIDPIYLDHFVGIWKRTNTLGGQSQAPEFLIFNRDETFSTNPYTHGTSNGTVEEVSEGDEGMPDTIRRGLIVLSQNHEKMHAKFLLKSISENKSSFKGGKKKRPRYNSLELEPKRGDQSIIGQGTRQLYAFFAYASETNMSIEDLLEQVS